MNAQWLVMCKMEENVVVPAKPVFYKRYVDETYIRRKKNVNDEHGTMIRTGITCKKIPCYMRDSACKWFIVKKTKIFRSYVKHF